MSIQQAQSDVTLFTSKEAATFLNVSKVTILHLLQQGKIPGKKVGRRYYLVKEDLIAFIRDQSKKDEKEGSV